MEDLLFGGWFRGDSLSRSIYVARNTNIELEKLISRFAKSSRDVMEIHVQVGPVGWRDVDIRHGHEQAHIIVGVVNSVFKGRIVRWYITFAKIEIHVAGIDIETSLVILCRIQVMIVAMISSLS